MCAAACRATHPEEARPSPAVRGDAQVAVADGSRLVVVGHGKCVTDRHLWEGGRKCMCEVVVKI